MSQKPPYIGRLYYYKGASSNEDTPYLANYITDLINQVSQLLRAELKELVDVA